MWAHDSYVYICDASTQVHPFFQYYVNYNWNDAEYSTLIKLALYSLTAAVQ